MPLNYCNLPNKAIQIEQKAKKFTILIHKKILPKRKNNFSPNLLANLFTFSKTKLRCHNMHRSCLLD